MYDPVGAFKDVFGGVQGVFAGLTGAAKISGAPSSEPSSQTVRSSKAPVRFILGRASTGGVLAWVQEQSGDQTSGEWIHIVYVLSEGAIAGVDEIHVDERPLSELGANAASEVIIDPAQVNAFLLANCPDWRQEQIGRGLSFVRLSFKYDAEKFPSGIPDVRFVVRGRSDVYDPRSGVAGYSANTALLILWYLRNRCAIPDDEIIFQSFASAANVCDETVIGPDGKMSPRYFAGAVIGADEKRNTVLDNLLSACAGTLIRVGGRWSLQVGAYYGPADFTINEDMVIGTVEGTTEVSNSDAINTMRGTFVDPAQAWAETDYPEVAIQDWIAADGGELAESQSFAYVTDAYLAQRLANISLRRRRSGGSLSVPLNFNGYNCRPGRAVKVDLPSLNILGEFMVTEWTMGAADACKVTLKPYEQAIFDDAVGQPYDPLGFINLPVGGLAAVTGLAWTPSGVAEVVQGVLSWAPPVQTVLSYTVTIRKGAEVVQSLKVGGEASSCNINGLTSGTYAMSVVAFGPGTRSGEASINVNVGGPPVPESCAVYASVDTITLVPANLQNSLNGGTYEYFYATNPSAPIADAVYLGQGLTFTHTGLAFAKEYSYYVRSANAYGKSDFLYVLAATSSDPTQMLEVIAGQITESELGQELTKRIDLIDMNGPGSVNERLGEVRSDLNQQIADTNNAVAQVDSALTEAKNTLSEALAETQSDLQEQIDQIADLADSMPYKPDQAYTAGQGVLGENGKLYQAKGNVPAGNPPPNATYWTDIGEVVQTANGLAVRVQTVETKVQTLEGTTTAQSQQITGLQSGLTTTNQNVSAAQAAADAANTLAGGKGKVIVQSAAPAVADRLAQNLWIDTTGNANTPKRWNGSAWVAVTDKVATDAAAAAANALAVAQTKADASAVQSLTTKVTDVEGAVSAQGQSLTGLQSSLTTTNQNVTAAQQAAQDAATLAGGKGKVIVQSAAPAVADRLAQNLWIDTTNNANTPKRWSGSAWVAVTDKVATDAAAAAAAASALAATKADASTVNSLGSAVSQLGDTVSAQGQSITAINTSIGQVGGENWIYNPSFEKQGTNGLADGWAIAGASGISTTPSIVSSALAAGEMAQRIDITGLSASAWSRIGNPSARRIEVNAGAPITMSAYVRGTPGLSVRCEIQFLNSAGGAVSGPPVAANTSLTAEYARVSYSVVVPQGAVRCNYFVTCYGTASINAGFMEVDRTQIEFSSVMSGWHDNGAVNAGALAATSSAVQGLTGRVEQTESSLTAQSGAITSLQGNLTTTNQNVTAAQQAAQDAATLAGGKGKVIVQSAAPAVGDRLAQNLWIDTTGNANTPKRWNGSAWVAVTDKVATDAAAAAANALSVAQTKADATAVQSLTTRVTDAEGTLTSHGQSITGLQGSLTTTNQNVTAAQQAAQAASDAAGAKGKVLYQSAAPAAADRLAQNLWIDTTGNANTPKRWNGTAWVAVTDKVATDAATAAANALSQVATKADASTVQSLSNTVDQHGTAITANGQAITNINTSLVGFRGGKTNLLPAEYSVFGPTLPTLSGTSFTMSSVADPAALRGYALKLDWTSTTTTLAVHFSTSVAAAGMNMAFRNKRYIVSYYARASVAGHQVSNFIRVLQADGSSTVTGPASLETLGTEWARYAAVIDMRAATFTGTRMQLSFQMNRSGVANRTVWLDRIMIEEAADGAVEASAFSVGNSFDQSLSNAEATSALSARVVQTESSLTSVSNNVVSLANSIGEVGGENWIYNPSFEKQGTASLSDGWAIAGGSGAVVTPSRVASALAAGEIAQRIDVTGISPSVWARIGNPSTRRITVTPGAPVTMSAYVRGTPGLNVRCEIQFLNSVGGGISGTPVAANTPAASDFNRISHSVITPNEAVQCNFFVTCYGTASISNAFMEVDRTQIEFSATMSGWKDNGKVAIAEQSALSTAVDTLSSTVSQQGGTLTSVGNRTTALENSVNNASTGLATKASASSVTALGNRVTATEGSLTSASSNITDLQNTLGGMNGGVNLIPAEYSVFGSTPPAMNRQSNLSASTIANAGATGKFLLKLESTVSQVNYFYLAASGTDWTMKLKPGKKYILSFWAQADAARAMSLRIRYPNAAGTNIEVELAQVNVTTTLTRVSAVMTMPAALVENCCLVFYQARTASASTHWYDGFMLEEQVGGNEAPSSFSVGSSARETQATSRALNEMSSTVTAQGETISAQAQSISGLQTSVGNNAAAIQNEATARASADSALSQQIQTTQSSLGDTNASVQQISTAQTGLNNRVNAQYSIKVAVTQSGVYALGGIGVGIQNQNGVLQSVVAVLADRFAVINATGDGFVSPFAVQGGQVFMNDAFIRDASITNAKIANAAITSAKIGVAEVDTLRIRGNAVTVPVAATSAGNVVGGGVGQWRDLIAVGVQMDEAGYITAQYSCYQGFGSGIRKYQFRMEINGLVIAEGGGDWADGFPNLMGSIGVGVGYFVITVKWWGENSGVSVQNHTLYAMGTKR
ncbi:phage tail tip fiber protein [Pseudomonas juntendi]|uniref:phage tail tip fiber protein n=5 Tax=Pseudomonas TaxID=286 RepID=UPI001F1EEDF9|nr:DUF1983 domain-containing protein [Pseudomonas juntendi]UJW25228.1 DUF1983 domain-containing protein [Pseudomonas juntendi]